MKKITSLVVFVSVLLACQQPPEPRAPVANQTGTFMKESSERNKALAENEKKAILKIIENDSLNDYKSSPDGFWYTYQNKADSTDTLTPKKGDLVIFEYDILSLNGDTIYSKETLGEREYYMEQERLFSGLRQGLKLMKENEKVTFLFPSYKAFGFYGDKEKIGSNVPIQSTVNLKSIEVTTKKEENEEN
ncbi:MAG: gliding motility-associated peptidyl-prolyl isomerase GldI [Bacteroidota bacterium]